MTSTPNPDSILAKLRHRAKVLGLEPQLMLLFYIQERFLARLAASSYSEHLVLKGGLNLYSRYKAAARPTRDIDLAGRGMPGTVQAVADAIRAIAGIELEDGLVFDSGNIEAREIIEDAAYTGIRVEVWVRLGKSRERLQLDISFGNAITPAPVELSFPSLLTAQDHRILGYPLETILAEKLAAATELGLDNTRMKDFFDVYWILSHEAVEHSSLRLALERTFAARGTELGNLLVTLQALDNPDTQRLWAQFRQNNKVEAPPDIGEVFRFIVPQIQATLNLQSQ